MAGEEGQLNVTGHMKLMTSSSALFKKKKKIKYLQGMKMGGGKRLHFLVLVIEHVWGRKVSPEFKTVIFVTALCRQHTRNKIHSWSTLRPQKDRSGGLHWETNCLECNEENSEYQGVKEIDQNILNIS